MLKEIIDNINERIKGQPDSRCASADEVRICWLVGEIETLNRKIEEAKKCLENCREVGLRETVNNTYRIL